jgi:hypothetical protein
MDGKTASLLIQKSIAKLCPYRFRNQHRRTVPLPIQKSMAKNYNTADSKISGKTAPFSIQKSAMKNCAAADSKTDSQKLRCYRLRNGQPKIVMLPIQKSTAKLCRCQFRNRQ